MINWKVFKFLSFFSTVILLLFQACTQKNNLAPPFPYQTLPEFICAYGDTPFDSIDIQTFENGNYFSLTFLNEGQAHGNQLFFHENGQIKTRRFYCMGEINGPYFTFFEDGELSSKGYYFEGRMSGSWRFFYPNGNLREVVYFIENQENGPFREYHENGQLKAMGYYIGEDKEHGLLSLFTEDGELKRKMRCNNGICLTIPS